MGVYFVQTAKGEFKVFADRPDHIASFSNKKILFTKQVHSSEIVHFSALINSELIDSKPVDSNSDDNRDELESRPQADGLYWKWDEIQDPKFHNLVFAVQTADCLPVYLEGSKGGALIHAGWRGLENKILQQSVLNRLDVQSAIIGPSIHIDNYEVGAEFEKYFSSRSLKKSPSTNTWLFSPQAEAHHQLKELFGDIKVKQSNLCTYEHPHLYSYRRYTHQQANKAPITHALGGRFQNNWNLFVPFFKK